MTCLYQIRLESIIATDDRITERVKEALKLVDIQLMDHLILNKDEEYASI
jgi:DNA repair protein RadC